MRQSSEIFLIENRHYRDEVRQAPVIGEASRFSHIPIDQFLEISRLDFNEKSAVDMQDRQTILSFLNDLYHRFDTWQATHEQNMEYLRLNRHHLKNAEQGYCKRIFVKDFWRIIRAEFIPSYGAIDESDFNKVKTLLVDCYREFDKYEAAA